jgi:CheY-like chemotaxis protein
MVPYARLPGPGDIQRVLIVEDDFALREALSAALKDEGYDTKSAANGREALDVLREDPTPCLVISDLMMPVMNGWELYDEMQSDENLQRFPVLFLSAFPATFVPTKNYLPKPLDVANLLHVVRDTCGPPN